VLLNNALERLRRVENLDGRFFAVGVFGKVDSSQIHTEELHDTVGPDGATDHLVLKHGISDDCVAGLSLLEPE